MNYALYFAVAFMLILLIMAIGFLIYALGSIDRLRSRTSTLEKAVAELINETERIDILDSQYKDLEKTVEQTYKTFGQLYNKEANK